MEDVHQNKLPKPQTEDTNEQPKIQSIIISANGLIIKSKLNPDAKEFYPSNYKANTKEIDQMEMKTESKTSGATENPLQQPEESVAILNVLEQEKETDTEHTAEEVMPRCGDCKDLFHLHHLEASPAAVKLVDSDLHRPQYENPDRSMTSGKVPVEMTVLLDVKKKSSEESKEDIVTDEQQEKIKEKTHESGEREIIEAITDKIGDEKETQEVAIFDKIKDGVEETNQIGIVIGKGLVEKPLIIIVAEEQPAEEKDQPGEVKNNKGLKEEIPKITTSVQEDENKVIRCLTDNKLKEEQKQPNLPVENIIVQKIGCLTEEEFNEERELQTPQDENKVDEKNKYLTAEEFNEEKELQDLAKSYDNLKENVCGDVKSENPAHAGNTGEYGDSVDLSDGHEGSGNEAQQKVENETDGFDFQINTLSDSQTKITPTLNACVLAGKAPPTTPTEEYFERRSQEDRLEVKTALKEKSNTTKEEKPKTEKKGTGKKITKLFMGACRKTSTFGEKSTTKTSSTSSNVSSHTKRISESLHNLSTTLKSKSDVKKSEGSTRLIPRSTTNIPRNAVRSRTLLSKPSETNGLKKDSAKLAPKDAISLRSTSSTEKSITSKSSLSNKTLSSKTSNTSTRNVEKPSSTSLASKSKESVSGSQKLPRGTVASSLRKTEAHKRRNLFPNDDPEANIELSQFLFK